MTEGARTLGTAAASVTGETHSACSRPVYGQVPPLPASAQRGSMFQGVLLTTPRKKTMFLIPSNIL